MCWAFSVLCLMVQVVVTTVVEGLESSPGKQKQPSFGPPKRKKKSSPLFVESGLGETIAISDEDGLHVFTLGSNSLVTLFDENVMDFAYDPKERHLYAVTRNHENDDSQEIQRADLNSNAVEPVSIELGRSSCPYSLKHSESPKTPSKDASFMVVLNMTEV